MTICPWVSGTPTLTLFLENSSTTRRKSFPWMESASNAVPTPLRRPILALVRLLTPISSVQQFLQLAPIGRELRQPALTLPRHSTISTKESVSRYVSQFLMIPELTSTTTLRSAHRPVIPSKSVQQQIRMSADSTKLLKMAQLAKLSGRRSIRPWS